MSDAPVDASVAGPSWRTQLGIGAALLLVALVLWLDAATLRAPSVVGVGPSAAVRLVAAFVAVLGIAHFVAAWRQRARRLASGDASQPYAHGNLVSLAWVLGALVGLIGILLVGGGFVLASTWLFAGTARGFGERLSAKSVAIGFVLATLVYLFFSKALSLGLPAGPLERLLG